MTDRTERAALADGVLVAVTAIWGASFVVVQDAVRLADPFTFLLLRFIVGGAVLTVRDWRALADRRLLRAGVGLGALLFVGFITQTAGLQFTTPSRSGFLTGLSVLLVPFVGLLLFRRWPSPPVLLGVALAVAGLWFLTGGMSGGGRGDGEGRFPDHRLRDRLRLLHRAARAGGPGPPLDAAGGGAAVGRGAPGARGAAVRAAETGTVAGAVVGGAVHRRAEHGRLPACSDLGAGADLGGAGRR